MGNTRVQDDQGGLEMRLATWSRAQWKSLFAAVLVSLIAHLVLLMLVHVPREGEGRAPAFVVSLTGAMQAERSASPASPRAPVTASVPQPPRPPAAPTHRARPQQARAAATDPGRQVAPPLPAITQPQPTPSQQEQAPPRPDAPVQPASPVSMPELGDVTRKVTGRRLQATVWIAEDGHVSRAFVKRNEISDEVAVLLEQALAGVRFEPAMQGGRPVADIVDTRLCFDSAGVLVAPDADCLQPRAAEQPAAAPLR